jgi:hypothetical protein
MDRSISPLVFCLESKIVKSVAQSVAHHSSGSIEFGEIENPSLTVFVGRKAQDYESNED